MMLLDLVRLEDSSFQYTGCVLLNKGRIAIADQNIGRLLAAIDRELSINGRTLHICQRTCLMGTQHVLLPRIDAPTENSGTRYDPAVPCET